MRQLVVPEPPTVAPETTSTATILPNPTIVPVESGDVFVVDGHVADVPQHVNSLAETFATRLQELTASAGPLETIGLGVPTTTQLPGNVSRGSAHARTPSDVSVGFSAERCPICHQIHLSMLLSVQMLEQHGHNLDFPRAFPAHFRQQPSPLSRGTSRQQRLDPDAATALSLRLIACSLLLLAFSFSVDVLCWLLSKPK